jgi:hypothetical protein
MTVERSYAVDAVDGSGMAVVTAMPAPTCAGSSGPVSLATRPAGARAWNAPTPGCSNNPQAGWTLLAGSQVSSPARKDRGIPRRMTSIVRAG